jgi:hypothetical protein
MSLDCSVTYVLDCSRDAELLRCRELSHEASEVGLLPTLDNLAVAQLVERDLAQGNGAPCWYDPLELAPMGRAIRGPRRNTRAVPTMSST